MKRYFDFRLAGDCRLTGAVLCLLFALVVGGCGKSDSTPPKVVSPPTADSTSTAAVQPTPEVAPAATPAAAPTVASPPNQRMLPSPSNPANSRLTPLQVLNRALFGWEVKNHRPPQTFEEFASSAGIQIPAPPAGKKYAFSPRGFIVLVNENQQ